MSIKALSGKVYVVITGASRGIGRQIAIAFGSILQEGSHMVLLARSRDGLRETAMKIPSGITVDTVCVSLDKATKSELSDIVISSLKDRSASEFDRLVIVHNVGTMGNLHEKANELTDIDSWRKYYDLNVFIPAILNGVIMDKFRDCKNIEKTVINITSLLGIQPIKCATHYCTGKAAREMFFKVLALEYPEVNVLNYSPGPVETDMFHELCNEIGDDEIKTQFLDLLTKKTVLTCEQTVNKLLKVLESGKYKSGDHVDYYDEL